MTEYSIHAGGSERGPFTLGQVRSMFTAGDISLADYLRVSGDDDWLPVREALPILEVKEAEAPQGKSLGELRASSHYSVARALALLVAAIMILIPWASLISMIGQSGSLISQGGVAGILVFVGALLVTLFAVAMYQVALALLDSADALVELVGATPKK